MEQTEKLIEYIKHWRSIDGIKPKNETLFITEFIKFLDNIDLYDIEFDGEGSYGGNQLNIQLNRCYGGDMILWFELVYDVNSIVIYSGNHHGFWTPEYVSIDSTHNYFEKLNKSIANKLIKVFGMNHLIKYIK